MSDRQQMRTYFSAEQATKIERYAIDHDQTYAGAVRDLVDRGLGMEAAQESAPWLADLLDAVLSRYFQGFPQTLDRLVMASFEQRKWAGTHFVRLIELIGDKSIDSQNQRVAKLTSQIQEWAKAQADDFFQSLAAPEELIEPDEPDEATE